MTTDTTPTVLFVCVHNAGRSQMAAAFLTHHAAGRIAVRSAGSEPAHQLNLAVVEAMREVGIDITAERDRKSTRLNSSHVAISYADFCLKKKKKNVYT